MTPSPMKSVTSPRSPQFRQVAVAQIILLSLDNLSQSHMDRAPCRNGIVITIRRPPALQTGRLYKSWPGPRPGSIEGGPSNGFDRSARIRARNSFRDCCRRRGSGHELWRSKRHAVRQPRSGRPRRLDREGSGRCRPAGSAASPASAPRLALLVESRPPRLRLALGIVSLNSIVCYARREGLLRCGVTEKRA
jgi:hypothetical protein